MLNQISLRYNLTMYIKANLSKDVGRIELFLGTDIASLAMWNSKGIAWVNSLDVYTHEFNLFFNQCQSKVENNLLGISTGSDGNFKVILNLNQGLSDQDVQFLYKSEKGISFVVDGPVCIGSPEWVGYAEKGAVERNMIDCLELPSGNYVVDAYSFLIKDPSGRPKYIQFAFSIFTQERYKQFNIEVKPRSTVLPLKYTP